MQTLKIIFISLFITFFAMAGDTGNHFYHKTDQFLKSYVKNGRVDYRGVRDRGRLNWQSW